MRLFWALCIGVVMSAGCQGGTPEEAAPADSAAADPAGAPSQTAAPEGSPEERTWQLSVTTHPGTGAPTTVLHAKASEVRAQSVDGVPTLFIRCREGTTDLYIDWHDYLPGAAHPVTVRLDRGPVRTQRWTLSRSNVATFYPEAPEPFLKEMIGARRLTAEATPYDETPVTAVFDVTDLAAEIQPIREACGW